MHDAKRLDDLFKTIDAKNLNGFLELLSPNASFRFGNAPTIQGHDAIGKTLGTFFDGIEALKHDLNRIWTHETSIVCDGEVTYTRKDGSQLTVPFAMILGFRADLISECLTYIDVSEL